MIVIVIRIVVVIVVVVALVDNVAVGQHDASARVPG